MKKHFFAPLLALALVFLASAGCFALGGREQVFEGRVFVSDTQTRLAPGAVEHKIVTNNKSGTDQNIDFFCDVDAAGTDTIKVMSCYAGYSTLAADGSIGWQMMTLPEQAKRAQAYFDAHPEEFPHYKVVGVLVGDTYNMGTGEPSSVLVMNGVEYQKPNGSWYFAVTKEGKGTITNTADTTGFESAVGGMGLLVHNGQNVSATGNTYVDSSFSRAAIGVTADGHIVTFCTYGNSFPISCGYSWKEVGDYMIAQGCTDALMLDGSGSAEWCARYEGTDEVLSVSHPSDGSSRAVGSCLLVVSTAAPDGTLARVSIAPDTTVYTPSTETADTSVAFTATGADSAGNHVELPENVVWQLAKGSEALGTLSETGVFTSNGTCGDVTVQMCYQDKVIGSATITIAKPDSISFSKDNEDVGRGKSTDLGLQVRYKNQDVILKDGDLRWTLTNSDLSSGEPLGTVSFDASTHTYRFTGNATVTCSGSIAVSSVFDALVCDVISVQIGKDPVKALDFESPADGSDSKAYYGLDANNFVVGRIGGGATPATGLLTRLNYNRGGAETARIVRVTDGYPVHSGENALQLNYDFSACGNGQTEGANLGLTQAVKIPGHPTAIGLWVWVPENTPNLWLRVRLSIYNPNSSASTPTTTQFDFTPQINTTFVEDGTYGGLSAFEEGTWHYCSADLSNYDGCTFEIPAGEAIRLMRTQGNDILRYGDKTCYKSHGSYLKDGTEVDISNLKGSVYFDDLMFVYGSVNADTDAPRVKEALVQQWGESEETQKPLTEGMTLPYNEGIFRFYVEDILGENKIAPVGMDFENCYLYVDGELMNGKSGTTVDTGISSLSTYLSLSDGDHSIRLLLSDKNGNKTSKTYHFTVQAPENPYPVYSVRTDAAIAPLGGNVPLTVHADDVTGLEKISATIQVDNRYKNGGYHITAAEGFSYEKDSAVYDEVNNTVTFTVTAAPGLTGERDIATIAFDIDRTLAKGSFFTYTVTAGIVTAVTSGAAGDYHPGFSLPQQRLVVDAPYTVSSDLLYVGMKTPGRLYVTDQEHVPGDGVGIYKVDGTLLGTTDANGQLTLDETILGTVQQFNVYAASEKGISFHREVAVYATAQSGSEVLFTEVENATTSRKLSWTSPISDGVVLRYAADAEGLEQAAALEVASQRLKFGGSSFASAVVAQVNSITLKDLTPGGTYLYQIRTDDGAWSEAKTFTVPVKKDRTDLFVLGDVQAQDTTNIEAIIDILNNGSYDLGIQTGDLVDRAYDYRCWQDALKLMEGFGDTDMLFALGNHEDNMGDDGSIAAAIYQMEHKDYYSVEYQNVYIANISYNSQEGYKEALDWLVKDANASDAAWKLVVMHQPTYYTNSSATDNLGMDTLTPAYFQKAGIHMVFSGHDHSYTRTAPLLDGKRGESYNEARGTSLAGDGIVYYICGSSGEKSYPIDPTLPFDYKATVDFTGVYLTVEATEDALTVKTFDLENAAEKTAKCIDEMTMYAYPCYDKGHVFGSESLYHPETKTLTCSLCGKDFSAEKTGYSGYAACGEGRVYLLNGVLQQGWVAVGEDIIHTGSDGMVHKTVSFTTETCTENGTRMAYCEECDQIKSYGTLVRYHNHRYDENNHCTNVNYDEEHNAHPCNWKAVDINDLEASLDYRYYTYTGGTRHPGATVIGTDGKKLIGKSTYGDYVIYYSNDIQVGMAEAKLKAYNSYYGERVFAYEIRPAAVTTVTAEEINRNDVTLSWAAAGGADHYYLQKYVDGRWVRVGETNKTTYTVTGLLPGKDYQFRVRSYAVIEPTKQRLDGTYDPNFWALQYSDALAVTTGDEDQHHWNDGEISKAATCTAAGEKVFTCTACGEIRREEIPAKGHTYAPNYDGDASGHWLTCTTCKEKVVFSHKYSSWQDVEGTEQESRSCEVCGYTDVRIKAAIRKNEDGSYTIQLPEGAKDYTVTLPSESTSPGLVAVILNEDGSETVIRDSVVGEEGLTFTLQRDATVKLADRTVSFDDVQAVGHWAADDVTFVAARELFCGVGDGLFAPDATMTRAMMMTILARLDGMDTSSSTPWYQMGMAWSVAMGISDGTMPECNITREQMVTMLWRYAGKPAATTTRLSDFSDGNSVSAYAVTAMNWALENGILRGMDARTLAPQGDTSRGQAAAICHRFLLRAH